MVAEVVSETYKTWEDVIFLRARRRDRARPALHGKCARGAQGDRRPPRPHQARVGTDRSRDRTRAGDFGAASVLKHSEKVADRDEAETLAFSSSQNRVESSHGSRWVSDAIVKNDDHPWRKVLGDEPPDVGRRRVGTIIGIGRAKNDSIAAVLRKPKLRRANLAPRRAEQLDGPAKAEDLLRSRQVGKEVIVARSDRRADGEGMISHLVPFRTETANEVGVSNCAIADQEKRRMRTVLGEYVEHLGSVFWGRAIIEGQRHQGLSGVDPPYDARRRPSEGIEGPKGLRDDHCAARHQQAAKDKERATQESRLRQSHSGPGLRNLRRTPRSAADTHCWTASSLPCSVQDGRPVRQVIYDLSGRPISQ